MSDTTPTYYCDKHTYRVGQTGYCKRHLTYRIGACIKLIKKPLVPGIDTVLQDLLNNVQQTILALSVVR